MSTRDVIVSKGKKDFKTILHKWVNLTGISAVGLNLHLFVTYTNTNKNIYLIQNLPNSFKIMV